MARTAGRGVFSVSRRNTSKSKRPNRFPRQRLCRRTDLQIHPLEDGCVVYQPDPDRVHFLNLTAALVLELCDGRHGVRAIEKQVAAACGHADPGRNLTGAVLERFLKEGLVTVGVPAVAAAAGK